jgi:outer membrane protein TolC
VQANVDVALKQFELGTITSVELRDVQEQFIEAESRLLTAQFEAKQAEVELLRLSGQLLKRVRSAP